MSPENKEVQTRNYWQACQWLADKTSPQTRRDHAVAMLKAQAECAVLGPIADMAKTTLDNNNIDAQAFALWQGSRS